MKVQAIQLSFSNVNHINLPQNNNSLTFNAKFKPAQQQEIKQKIGTNLITIVKRLGEESGNLISKIVKRPELPLVSTAVIASSVNWNNYDQRTVDLLKELDRLNVDISSVGNINRSYNGGLQSIDKTLINNAIDKAQKNNVISQDTASKLHEKVSFCGNDDGSSYTTDYGTYNADGHTSSSSYDGSSTVDDDCCDSDSECDDDCCDSDCGDVDIGSCC